MADRTVKLNVIADGSQANQVLDGVAGKSEGTAGRASKAFGSMFSSLSASGVLGPFTEQLGHLQTVIDQVGEHGKSVSTVLMGMGGGTLAAGGLLTAAASKDTDAENQLKQAIENTGNSLSDYEDKIKGAVSHQEGLGYTASQTDQALQAMTQGMGDPQKALDYLGQAADLAAAKHEDLSTAATQMVQIYEGKGTKVLVSMGISTNQLTDAQKNLDTAQKAATTTADAKTSAEQKLSDLQERLAGKTHLTTSEEQQLRDARAKVWQTTTDYTTAQNDLAQSQQAAADGATKGTNALDLLAQKTSGQASAATDSWGGKIRAVTAWTEDHIAVLGQKYGPALMGVGAAMTAVGGIMDVGRGILGMFTTASDTATVATEGLAVAETEEGASSMFALGPILLIIGAIALLALGIYELIQHWGAVSDAVTAAWAWIQNVTMTAWNWITGFFSNWWPVILMVFTGGLSLVVGEVIQHWDSIVGFVTGLPGKLASAGAGLWDWVYSGIRGAVDQAISILNAGIGFLNGFQIHISTPGLSIAGHDVMPDWNYDWNGPHIPYIPYLAEGGIALGPTLAMIGDNPSQTEAIVPLEKAQQFGFGGGGPRSAVVTTVINLDGREIARNTREHMIREGGRDYLTGTLA